MSVRELPHTFTYGEGTRVVGERTLREMVTRGEVERLGRGLYRKPGAAGDEELVQIAMRARLGTVSLTSALAHHDLTDEIPRRWDIAIPRGTWAPVLDVPVQWHRFDTATFEMGRGLIEIADGLSLGIYSAERSIVDIFRLRHTQGADVAAEALRRWLRTGGQPSSLLAVAEHFPRALAPIRGALEILL